MQKYKLLKDLPLAKAGTIVSLNRESRKKTYWQASIMWETGAIAYIPQWAIQEWLEEIPEKPKSVWDLKEGDKYFYLSEIWDICIAEHIWHILDDERIQIGNAFLEKSEAVKELKKRVSIAKIKKYCSENGIETEYGDYNNIVFTLVNWFICYNSSDKNWNPLGYFNALNAQKILEKFEEELKIILE